MRLRTLCFAAVLLVTPDVANAAVTQVATLSALRTGLTMLDPVVIVNDAISPGDGGGGTFVNSGVSSCLSFYSIIGDDGGVVIQATISGVGSACYYRQFTGAVHLKWYGVTWNQTVTTACPGMADCLKNAFYAAKHFGSNSASVNYPGAVDLDGLRIVSTADVTPLVNQRLTCGATLTGEQVDSLTNPDYSKIGGAIVLSHGARVFITNSQTEIDHCIVLTEGVAGTSPVNLNPMDQRTLINDYKYMAVNADTGILCDGGAQSLGADQPYIHDVTVVGFDTGIAAFGCPRFRLDGADIDANVGVSIGNGKSPAYIANVRADNFLALRLSGKDTQYNINRIDPDGTVCKVTVPGTSNNLSEGDTVFVLPNNQTDFSDMGVISCHGRFVAVNVTKVTDTTLDLQGSSYGTASSPFDFLTTTTASWVKNSQVINVPTANAVGIRAGETVFSLDDGTVFGGATVTVLSVSKYAKNGMYKVVVNAVTKDASSGSPRMRFQNVGPYIPGTGILTNSQIYLYPNARIYAGDSIGGAATGGRAACIQGGGPGDTSALAIIANNNFCYGHLLQYHFDSVDPLVCTGCGMDGQPEISDDQQIGLFYGKALPPLQLKGNITNLSDVITNVTLLDGTSFDPYYAGWNIHDHFSATSGIVSGTTILNIYFESGVWKIQMSSPASATAAVTITDTASNASEPTGASSFVGSVKGGGNVIVDAINPDGSEGPCNSISGTVIGTNMKGRFAAELLGGCINMTGVSSSQLNDVLIGSGTGGLGAGSSILGNHINGSLYYENPSAVSVNAASNAFDGGETGNGVRQCNTNYATGCVQYSLNSSGAWRLLDSSLNPVQEFKDSTHMHLGNTYQDAIVANSGGSAPILTAGINVVGSCVHTGCINGGVMDKVKLPTASTMVDVLVIPSGSACATAGAGNCGAGGAVTVVNNTANPIQVVPSSTDTLNGVTTGDTLASKKSRTYWPVSSSPGEWSGP